MDGFTWWILLSKWAKEAGFSPLTTALIAMGVAILVYLGKIFKGIRAGYGVILQDQKDAALALREQVELERIERKALVHELEKARDRLDDVTRALSLARTVIASHNIPVPPVVTDTLDTTRITGNIVALPKEPPNAN